MRSLQDCFLYTFVDGAYLRGRPPQELAAQLCDGGSDLVQLRLKEATQDHVQRVAESILPITERAGVGLVINDYPAVAAAIGAPLCHLGQEDFFDRGYTHTQQIRQQAAPMEANLLVGLSTHGPAQAQRALEAGADYVAIGPVFATGTKPTAKPVTIEYVRWAARHVPVPWFAIGGINLETLPDVLEAGAQRICVVSAILAAPDPVKACKTFKERIVSAARDWMRKP
ncbi:MAG: thiamine phosphate synthase [Verrucomicrobiota bacterium]